MPAATRVSIPRTVPRLRVSRDCRYGSNSRIPLVCTSSRISHVIIGAIGSDHNISKHRRSSALGCLGHVPGILAALGPVGSVQTLEMQALPGVTDAATCLGFGRYKPHLGSRRSH